MVAARYGVEGMTCGHCITAITNEVAKIPGVTEIAVDLQAASLSFTSTGDVDVAAVRSAVDEAGYTLVGAL